MANGTKMRILHLLSQIPETTGSGIYLQSTLQYMAKKGFQNYLIAGIPAGFTKHKKFLEQTCNDYSAVHFGKELPFAVVGMSDVMPYQSTCFCDLSPAELSLYEECFKQKLTEAIERWRPDLIHSHHLWILTSLTRQLFPDIPLITSCHGSDLRQFQNCAHLQSTVIKGCKDIDAVCALNLGQKESIQNLYGIEPHKIHVTSAGYNSERFYLPNQPSPKKPVQILYAGKLSNAKGVPWLLKALINIPNKSFIFHLVGDSHGAEKEEILALANKLNGNIKIHGKIEHGQLANLMRQTDLFVLPSFYEGLPLVLLEALACGSRIIATALPGVVDLFSGINSSWIDLIEQPKMVSIDVPEATESEKFTAALTQAIIDQCEQISLQNNDIIHPNEIKTLLKNYTWEAVFLKLEHLYQQLSSK